MREGLPAPTYHVSCVMCQVSHVMCHMSHVNFFLIFFQDIVVKLVGGGSVINGATPSSLLLYLSLVLYKHT